MILRYGRWRLRVEPTRILRDGRWLLEDLYTETKRYLIYQRTGKLERAVSFPGNSLQLVGESDDSRYLLVDVRNRTYPYPGPRCDGEVVRVDTHDGSTFTLAEDACPPSQLSGLERSAVIRRCEPVELLWFDSESADLRTLPWGAGDARATALCRGRSEAGFSPSR